jgi:hypothetical protein
LSLCALGEDPQLVEWSDRTLCGLVPFHLVSQDQGRVRHIETEAWVDRLSVLCVRFQVDDWEVGLAVVAHCQAGALLVVTCE